MPRTKLHKPKPTIEQPLQPEQITVQMEGSVLEAVLVAALQPLYQEIAELKQAQAISNKALTSLIERIQSQELTLTQFLDQLQDLLKGEK